MNLNQLSANKSRIKKKRVGRGLGSGCGKTCGRGHKGQNSRSGGGVKAGFEGGQQPLQRRLPAFGAPSKKAQITAEIRLSDLHRITGELVSLETLRDAGLIHSNIKFVKIFKAGSLNKFFKLEKNSKNIRVSKGARSVIDKFTDQ